MAGIMIEAGARSGPWETGRFDLDIAIAIAIAIAISISISISISIPRPISAVPGSGAG
jgi:hypothetical protein